MSDVESLRAAVERANGPARARPLIELSQALIQRYLDNGPGKDAARPVLDEAIGVIEEAYGYFGPDDPMRAQVVATRGWLYGTRHIAHASPAEDRAAGLADLEEGLRSPHLPPASRAIYQLTLGQLGLAEVTNVLRSPDMASMLMNGTMPPGATRDVDRSIAIFEEILAGPSVGREVHDVTRVQLRMAEAMRTIVSAAGRSGSPSDRLDRMMSSVKVLQDIHQEQTELMRLGPDSPGRSFYFAEQIVDRDPIDRPTILVEVDDPAARPAPAPPVEVPADDLAGLRRRLRRRVAAGGDLIEALETLLDRPAAAPAGLIDEMVALATAVADTGGANPTDNLLLAAGLALRAAGPGGDELDREEAAAALARSAAGRRVVPPEVARLTRRIESMIDGSAD